MVGGPFFVSPMHEKIDKHDFYLNAVCHAGKVIGREKLEA